MIELILQCFQSAEVADLPAVLRFLLQQVNAQNASQVGLKFLPWLSYCSAQSMRWHMTRYITIMLEWLCTWMSDCAQLICGMATQIVDVDVTSAIYPRDHCCALSHDLCVVPALCKHTAFSMLSYPMEGTAAIHSVPAAAT